ncbi:hypothetical protein DL93DRAFT_2079385 [Clavulina sp. PMI_390]|nr:hypothetical protein DL93DRAFT_2079385 [Clavulina sp. PMI_390]
MEVVARSDLLEEWTWDTFNLTMPEPITFSPLDMPSLRRLSFYGELQFPLFGMLHAPELVALDLTYRPRREFWEDPLLPTLLSLPLESVSFPKLQVVALDGYPGIFERNEPSLVKFFRNHPTLKFVSLSWDMTEPLVEAISALPSLVHLNLSGVQGSDTHLQGWSFVRRWHAKATDNPRWSSPTLYDGGMWKDLEALSIPEELEGEAELCEFAQRVVLHPSKHVFRRQYGRSIAHWRNLLELCGSEPL